jgi:hypothetical protein
VAVSYPSAMSLTALRWLAVPLGLVSFAANMVRASWFEPLTYEMSFGWGMAAAAAGFLVTMGVPLGVFFALGYPRPARFARLGGRLVAPADPMQAGLMILFLGIAGQSFGEGGHLPMRLTAVVFYGAGAAAALLIQRPRLELDPAGLTIRHIRTVQRVEWERLAPGGPVPPTVRRPRELRVYLNEPPVPEVYPPGVSIPVNQLHIDAAYLAEAIRRFVEHPEARSEIAAPHAELAR